MFLNKLFEFAALSNIEEAIRLCTNKSGYSSSWGLESALRQLTNPNKTSHDWKRRPRGK